MDVRNSPPSYTERRAFAIRIAAHTFEPEVQGAALGWQSILHEHYPLSKRNLQAWCLCRAHELQARRLTIRKYPDGSLGLARFPDTGHEHDPACRFHGEAASQNGSVAYASVLQEIPGGMVVCTPLGLYGQEAALPSGCEPSEFHPTHLGREQMSLRGLLHLLIQRGEINAWWPRMRGKRNTPLVMHLLRRGACEIWYAEQPISEHLMTGLLARTYSHENDRQERVFVSAMDKRERLLCVIPLSQYSPAKGGNMERELSTWMFGSLPRLQMPTGLWARTAHFFPFALKHWIAGGLVLAIAQIDPSFVRGNHAWADVVALALQAVSSQWIPVDSERELIVCEQLVVQDRTFVKPLRFDAGHGDIFPQFILRDTGAPHGTPMEVLPFTNTGDGGLAQKKRRYYRENFESDLPWSWCGPPTKLPALPPRSARA